MFSGTQFSYPELSPRMGMDPVTGAANPWYPEERETAVRQWCEAAFEEAEADQKQSEEVKLVEKYIDYLSGKQWPAGRPSYRAKPVNNRMYRLFWEVIALLTDIRPIADVRSTERTQKYVDVEDLLNKGIKAWWVNNGIEMRSAMCIVYAMLTAGFSKLEWDPTANGGVGDISLVPLGPTAVLPLKPGIDLQDSEALIYNTVKPVGWVKRKHPSRAHLVTPDLDMSQYAIDSNPPSSNSPFLYDRLTPAFKRLMAKDRIAGASAFPMVRYREFWLKDYTVNSSSTTVLMGNPYSKFDEAYWVKPQEMLYPRGRLIVMAGRKIVHDGPNPYWHGLFPFSLCRLNIVPWSIYGLSDLRSLSDMQDIVNQILAGVLDMIKRAVNPPFFAPKSAFSEKVWNDVDLSMPGARLAYNAVSPGEPKVVSVAPLPGFVLNMQQSLYHEMDQQSNIAAVNAAAGKKQIPGADTLDLIRNVQQTPIRLKGRNIEKFISDNGAQLVPNMFQFYRKDRRVFLVGPDGNLAFDQSWDIESGRSAQQFMGRYKFTIVEGSLLSAQRVEMVGQLEKLRLQHDLDRRTFFDKASKLMNVTFDVDTIEKNLMNEAKMGMMAQPPKGGKGKK